MAGIGKAAASDAQQSIEELEKQFNECTGKIRTLLAGKKDKRDLDDGVKRNLRTEYSRAAQIAKTLSMRVTDRDKSEIYAKYFEQLSNTAASYGSVMKSQVPKTTMDDIKGLDDVKIGRASCRERV